MRNAFAVIVVSAFLAACGGEDAPSDPDGDGFAGAGDSCPGLAETFNGYQDADGCPDTPPQPPPPPPAVDPGFSGAWTGPTTITSPGQQPLTYTGSLTMAANGDTLTASRFCPDGRGSFSMTGNGRSVNWAGSYTCAYASSACATTTMTFTSATFVLNSTTSMTATSQGIIAGCGQSFNVTHTFNGSK